MESWDDRGQSIQVGAVLIFAALILLLSLYQATIVPQQNEQIEFDHSQQVQGELLDLRNAVVSMFGDAGRQSVSVTLGTTYPPRFLAVNPPPASGQLRTVATADGDVAFGLDNAEALDDETADFWDGGPSPREYSTGGIVYRPNYNEYGQPPSTVYENSVLYDDFSFEGATIARSDQTLVDGNRISLVALNGSLQRSSSGATSLDVRPVSASSTTVSVRNASPGSPVTVRVATQLSEAKWKELLADQRADEGGNISTDLDAVRTEPLAGVPGYETLVVELVPGTYELQMAKAGVGNRVTETSEAYLTDVSGTGSTIPEGTSQSVVVEVRDRYNNPVSGVDVNGVAAGGTFEDDTVTTGSDGRARFRYETDADAGGSEYTLQFSYEDATAPAFSADDPEDVEMTVTVQTTGASGGGGGGSPYTLNWQEPTTGPDYTLDVGAEGSTVDMRAALADARGDVSPSAVNQIEVNLAVNNETVGTLTSYQETTDANGDVETTFEAENEGTVRVYATAGGASDVINITVTNMTGTKDPGFPYEDVNQDGSYQEGTDIQLEKSDVSGSYTAADGNGLVVPSSTGTIDSGAIDWTADGITVDVDIDTKSIAMDAGDRELSVGTQQFDSNGVIDLSGDSVDVTGASLDNYQGGDANDKRLTIEATAGDVSASGISALTKKKLTVTGANVDVSSATLDSYAEGNGNKGVTVSGSETVTATDVAVDSVGAIDVTGSAVDVSNARLDNYQGGDANDKPLTIEATSGDVTATGVSAVTKKKLTVTGTDVDVSGGTLDSYADGNGAGAVDLSASATMTATDATIDSYRKVTIAGGTVDVSGSSIDNYQGGNANGGAVDVVANSGSVTGTSSVVDSAQRIEFEGETMDLSDASLDNYQSGNGAGKDIVLRTTAGDMVIEGIVMRKTNNAKHRAFVTSENDLFVEDAEFYKGSGKAGKLNNENGVDVTGDPAVGRVK